MVSETLPHVLMVSFPAQGHVTPLLRLAKRLASEGVYVTFSTTHHIGHMIQKSTYTSSGTPFNIGNGQLCFEFFSDGWEDYDDIRRWDLNVYIPQLETVGRDSFVHLVKNQSQLGRPVSCIVNNPFVPWALDVATEMGIPGAVLWVQSCAVYSAYFHYFHNLASFPTPEQPNLSVKLPGLPALESDELPSFLHPFSPSAYNSLKNIILKQFENLEKCFCVLIDTFEEIEQETIKEMLNLSHLSPLRPVGPLCKLTDAADNKLRADMWSSTDECIKWLDTKPPSSLVYVSFGSVISLGRMQMEELARGLLNSGKPFLWVVKPPPKEFSGERGVMPEGFLEEAKGKGLVVEWCQQDEVLAHPSLGCFVTHCGWNSSTEILSSGVPMVAAPQWGDQVTNAKFLTEVYGVGVRLLRGEKDLETLSRVEVERYIMEVMSGPKAEEMKMNALKWKKAAMEAVGSGGSSQKNLQAFVDDIRGLTSICPLEVDDIILNK